jgi:probable HAF family extracellular repeat protein
MTRAVIYDGTTLKDLNALNNWPYWSIARAINSGGQVTGSFHTGNAGNDVHAFLYDGAATRDLGTLYNIPGSSDGIDINDKGQVAGNSFNGFTQHAFLYDGNTMKDLGPFFGPGGTVAYALAVNESGQVAGWLSAAGIDHAMLYDGVAMKDLGTLANGQGRSTASAINDSGQVTGYSDTGNGPNTEHAFIYHNGVMKDLGTLANGRGASMGRSINASGQVTGNAFAGDNTHGFFYDGVAMRDIGVLPNGSYSMGLEINASSHIVGHADLGQGLFVFHAFVWSPADGKMVDLNTWLVDPPPGLVLGEANAISDSGYILASSNAGLLLLTPSNLPPKPSAPVLGPITANDPVPVGSAVMLSVAFTDANPTETHGATWQWNDIGSLPGTVVEADGRGTVTGTRTFSQTGVYQVTVIVTDSAGLKTELSRTVAVYDAGGGFVTGSGTISSPPGAYRADLAIAGEAGFALVAKYNGRRQGNPPDGDTVFRFTAASMSFFSESYEWLVVSGRRAQLRGSGTLNGHPGYGFQLTAMDGGPGARGQDRLRMKIWHYEPNLQQDIVDYENQIDSSAEGGMNEGSPLLSGNIAVHLRQSNAGGNGRDF